MTVPAFNCCAAPRGDEQLTRDDTDRVQDELLDAQTKSEELGRALNIPEYILDGIHKRYTDAKDSLHCVIVEFLRQEEPKPTWRAIVAALRSPEVNLPELARKIEAAHCQDHSPAATHGTLPKTITPLHLVYTALI